MSHCDNFTRNLRLQIKKKTFHTCNVTHPIMKHVLLINIDATKYAAHYKCYKGHHINPMLISDLNEFLIFSYTVFNREQKLLRSCDVVDLV